jgi:hypothetical protein
MKQLYPVRSYEIDKLILDAGTQMREQIDEFLVEEYAEAYRNGVQMPPIDVFTDGDFVWVGDGFHRVHGAKRSGMTEIPGATHNGTLEDAKWFACAANRAHGLRRTNADKRRAVEMALLIRVLMSNILCSEHLVEDAPQFAGLRHSQRIHLG